MKRRFNRRFRKAARNASFKGRSNQSTNYSQAKRPTRNKEPGRGLRAKFRDYLISLDLANKSTGQRVILVGFNVLTFFLICGVFTTGVLSLFTPRVSNFENYVGGESTIFYDRNGKVLFSVHDEENREVIESEDIPQHVKDAAVAIEDDRFYDHNGFDVPAILKAVLSEVGIGSARGGSTITQQLVKNTFLSPERTYTRKIKELMLSVRTERKFSKDEILTLYLNQIPYGGTAYGVEKAAEVFFDKDAKDLTLVEAGILAAIPQAPTYYSPYGSHKYTTLDKEFTVEELADRGKLEGLSDLYENEYTYGLLGKWYDLPNGERLYLPGRADEVFRRMEELGYINEAQKQEARTAASAMEFNQYKSNIKAPHFVFYVKELLEQEYGKDLVETGGIKVYTTLDLDMQREAEDIIAGQVSANRGYSASNAALASINAKNGQVLVMVGSADYFNEEIDGNVNITTSLRQPGSSFKPIVYASAFINKYAPASVIFDVPMKLGEQEPDNYDGNFVGPMTIRRALAQSRNIPAIKAYFLAGEQDTIISNAEKMGINSLDRRIDYGWPMALGTGEVQMMEMVQAFSVFANNGDLIGINPILRIEDAEGKVIVDYGDDPRERPVEVIDPQAAYLITDILSDKANNLGPILNLNGRVAAAKTGTSNKRLSDTEIRPSNIWTIGYTPQIVTAVWAGNSDGEAMSPTASGYGGAAPAWQKFMNYAHTHLKLTPEEFEKPRGIKSVQVSKLSGLLPGRNTPTNMVTTDLFASYAVPTEVDSSFSVAVADIRNGKLPNEYCPEEFVREVTFWNPKAVADKFNWQSEIIAWASNLDDETKKRLGIGDTFKIGSLIDEESELCKSEFAEDAPVIEITSPSGTEIISTGTLLEVEVDVDAPSGIARVEYYFGESLQVSREEAPYSGTIRVPTALKPGQEFTISAKVIDENGYSAKHVMTLTAGERE